MPNLLQYCVLSFLLLSSLFVCKTSSRRNRSTVKTLEVPVSSIIQLNDGRQHYFNLTSEYIARNPLVEIQSSEESARFYVSVMETNLHVKKYCKEPINITSPTMHKNSHILCHGVSNSITMLVIGNFSLEFKSNTVNHTPTEVHILRYLTTKNGSCESETDFKCSHRCLGIDAICDGQKHCLDGSDEKRCSTPSTWTYSPTTARIITSTTPASDRRCDIPGVAVEKPDAKKEFKKSWTVASYSTGIVIGTVFCSLVVGFCFTQPYPDDQDEQEEPRSECGERHLDPVLDHPPSYEDVMSMNLAAAPHRHAVPKTQTPESP